MKRQRKDNDKELRRDITWSLLIHLLIIAATVVSSPFDVKVNKDYGEVIRVSLSALPEMTPAEPVALSQPTIPSAIPDAPAEIPIDDPTTVPAVEVPEKPKPKPKPKPPKETPKEPATQTTENAGGDAQNEIDAPETSGGSPFAGATIDQAGFDYPYWFTMAFNKIRGNWRNPVSSDGRIICTIYFQVIKSGRVIETRIEESSGIPAFDKACVTAVERSAPFPPLPQDFVDEIIGITLPFQYKP